MIRFLSDTNIALRWVRQSDPGHGLAVAAVEALLDQGEKLYVTAQNLIEFWSVATRPAEANGMGMTLERPLQISHGSRHFSDLLLMTPQSTPSGASS